MRRDAEAVVQFEKAAQLDPKQVSPLLNLGMTQCAWDMPPPLWTPIAASLRSNREARGVLWLGLAQFKQAQYDEAVKTFGQITQSTRRT